MGPHFGIRLPTRRMNYRINGDNGVRPDCTPKLSAFDLFLLSVRYKFSLLVCYLYSIDLLMNFIFSFEVKIYSVREICTWRESALVFSYPIL